MDVGVRADHKFARLREYVARHLGVSHPGSDESCLCIAGLRRDVLEDLTDVSEGPQDITILDRTVGNQVGEGVHNVLQLLV